MPPPYNPMKDFNFRSGLLSGRPPLPAGPLLGGLPEVPGMTSTPPPPAMPPPTTPMRSPMAAHPSPMNHSYGGGLADRPTRPSGRSNYDLNRIAEREYRQRKDPRLLFSMDWRNRMGGPSAPYQPKFDPTATPMTVLPQATAAPQGRWTPGFNGSQIFVKDDAVEASPQRPADASPRVPRVIPQHAPEGSAAPPMVPGGNPLGGPAFQFPMLPAAMQRPGELPPSTLGGSAGLPPPPMVGSIPIPQTNGRMVLTNGKPTGQTFTETKPDPEPFIPTPEQVKAHNLVPDFSNTTVFNGRHYPAWKAGKPQEQTVKVIDDAGKVREFPAGYELPPRWTELKPKGAGADAPSASAAATTAPVKTQTGNSFKRAS